MKWCLYKDIGPKDTLWCLHKDIGPKGDYYEFEIWDINNTKSIAYIRRNTPSAMAKSIKALVKKLSKK